MDLLYKSRVLLVIGKDLVKIHSTFENNSRYIQVVEVVYDLGGMKTSPLHQLQERIWRDRTFQCFGSGSGLDPDSIRSMDQDSESGCCIQIQEGKNDPQN